MFINIDSQIYISLLDFANVCVQFNHFLTCLGDVVTIRPIIFHTINPAHAREILISCPSGVVPAHTQTKRTKKTGLEYVSQPRNTRLFPKPQT